MIEWRFCLWALASGLGVGLFLKAVADAVDLVEREMHGFEEQQRRAIARRKAAALLAGDGANGSG
jgi:hypothetical protein